jgi:hypothetical protein
VKKSFNVKEHLHRKFKHHGTKPMQPSSSRAFQRHQEQNVKHPSSVDLITTKQTTFIDKIAKNRHGYQGSDQFGI